MSSVRVLVRIASNYTDAEQVMKACMARYGGKGAEMRGKVFFQLGLQITWTSCRSLKISSYKQGSCSLQFKFRSEEQFVKSSRTIPEHRS